MSTPIFESDLQSIASAADNMSATRASIALATGAESAADAAMRDARAVHDDGTPGPRWPDAQRIAGNRGGCAMTPGMNQVWRPFPFMAPRLLAEHLGMPLTWTTPSIVGVEPVFDLFAYTSDDLAALFGVMAAAWWHTFTIRTYLPVMRDSWFQWLTWPGNDVGRMLGQAADAILDSENGEFANAIANYVNGWSRWSSMPDDGHPLDGSKLRWPLPNVHIEVVPRAPGERGTPRHPSGGTAS